MDNCGNSRANTCQRALTLAGMRAFIRPKTARDSSMQRLISALRVGMLQIHVKESGFDSGNGAGTPGCPVVVLSFVFREGVNTHLRGANAILVLVPPPVAAGPRSGSTGSTGPSPLLRCFGSKNSNVGWYAWWSWGISGWGPKHFGNELTRRNRNWCHAPDQGLLGPSGRPPF